MGLARLTGAALVEYFHKGSMALIGRLAAKDPSTWTAAEIKDMYAQFTDISEQVSGAKADWDKEQSEADAIVKIYNQRLKSVELLNAKAEELAGDAKASMEASRDTQMAAIEKMLPDVEREKSEAKSARQLYDDMSQFCKDFSDKLKDTERQMHAAEQAMRTAELEEKRAEMREQTAKAAAGLKSNGDKFNIVLTAMQKNVDATKKRADAANLRADLLKTTNVEDEDPNIKAAMEEAAGHEPVATMSFADRLAALKAKTA
jgi:DNA repair exonuclease SbcCD ATPase subunit